MKYHCIKSFSLVELMVVIAIIGILSAIAVPSYKTYIGKARVAEALTLVESWKHKVEEYFDTNGSFPAGYCASSGPFAMITNPSPYVCAIKWCNAGNPSFVQVVLQNINSDVTNGMSSINFNVPDPSTTNGIFKWACQSDPTYKVPCKYLPSNCQDSNCS